MKNNTTKQENKCCGCQECSKTCAMHVCEKCSPFAAIFGLLFLLAGLNIFQFSWFNGWTILGVMLIVVALSGKSAMKV